MQDTHISTSVPGTFYSRPAPDQPPYKAPGDAVKAGDLIALVEVMKTFIEVRADQNGTFVRYLVEDEDTVMAGDAISELET